MELKDLWNEIGEEGFGEVPARPDKLDAIRQSSRHPLEQLRRRLFQKFLWGVGIGTVFSGTCALALADSAGRGEGWLIVWLVLSLLIASSMWLCWIVWKAYKSLPSQVDLGGDVLSVLRNYRDAVRRIFRMENQFAYVVAFPSPAAGALLGMLSEGSSLAELVESGEIWVVVIIGIVMAPFVVWLTKKMNNYAFGRSLSAVEGFIEGLEKEEKADPAE